MTKDKIDESKITCKFYGDFDPNESICTDGKCLIAEMCKKVTIEKKKQLEEMKEKGSQITQEEVDILGSGEVPPAVVSEEASECFGNYNDSNIKCQSKCTKKNECSASAQAQEILEGEDRAFEEMEKDNAEAVSPSNVDLKDYDESARGGMTEEEIKENYPTQEEIDKSPLAMSGFDIAESGSDKSIFTLCTIIDDKVYPLLVQILESATRIGDLIESEMNMLEENEKEKPEVELTPENVLNQFGSWKVFLEALENHKKPKEFLQRIKKQYNFKPNTPLSYMVASIANIFGISEPKKTALAELKKRGIEL